MVVDRLFKYSNFLAFSHPYLAKDVAHLFITEVVRLHGFPKSIVSDRDKVVMSHFWTEIFAVAWTKLKYSTTFHPHTDGQIKVINKCLKKYLLCFAGGCPKRWLDWLSWAKYWFNTSLVHPPTPLLSSHYMVWILRCCLRGKHILHPLKK